MRREGFAARALCVCLAALVLLSPTAALPGRRVETGLRFSF